MPCVTEEEFEAAAGDVSSISGSDSESDNDNAMKKEEVPLAETPDLKVENSTAMTERKFHKVFFKTDDGELISVYRCLLHHKKNPLYEPENLTMAAKQLPNKKKWIILMVSAGHFAGAIFNGKGVIEHKTFHRYTVRAKRGTAQSTRDNQGSAPKSGGASLRRYNEAALVQEVQDLLSNWTEHIRTCDYVFVRIPVANRGMFFGGKNPALKKDDARIRVIPFATRRPTFSETKRVHQMLASVECYGQDKDVGDIIPVSPSRVYDEEKGQLEVRKTVRKPGKGWNRKQMASQPTSSTGNNEGNISEPILPEPAESEDLEEEEETEMQLVETLEEIDFSELKEFDSSFKRKPKKKKKPSSPKTQSSSNQLELDEVLIRWRNAVFTACKTGSIDSLDSFLEDTSKYDTAFTTVNGISTQSGLTEDSTNSKHNKNSESAAVSVGSIADAFPDCIAIHGQLSSETAQKSLSAGAESANTGTSSSLIAEFLNSPLSDNGTTLLHIAAKEGHADMVTALLTVGADPSIKDKGGKVPYNVGEVEVRNAMRRFMAKFPDLYDYTKAQVPSPLTAEMEAERKQKAAEKRKAKKKANQERNKEKKAAEALVRAENEERERFIALSDREKRALAAERRILQQHADQGSSKPVLSRCWQCGTDITGKVPFEYSDYKFCTTKCLKEHRLKSAN